MAVITGWSILDPLLAAIVGVNILWSGYKLVSESVGGLMDVAVPEERLATFLLNLSKRFVRRGYSPTEFHLRMTREEIGSYLGLKLETVSRLFSSFQKDGLIEVQQKHVRITDIEGLEKVVAERR